MNYRNGKEILPPELLKELQKYVDGGLIYVPRVENRRAGWGENNGARLLIEMRNSEIYRSYKNGATIQELVEEYHLSDDSIRKIISKKSKAMRKAIQQKGLAGRKVQGSQGF